MDWEFIRSIAKRISITLPLTTGMVLTAHYLGPIDCSGCRKDYDAMDQHYAMQLCAEKHWGYRGKGMKDLDDDGIKEPYIRCRDGTIYAKLSSRNTCTEYYYKIKD